MSNLTKIEKRLLKSVDFIVVFNKTTSEFEVKFYINEEIDQVDETLDAMEKIFGKPIDIENDIIWHEEMEQNLENFLLVFRKQAPALFVCEMLNSVRF